MSARPRGRSSTRPAGCLVLGESKNDVDSLRDLVLHINPVLQGRVHPRLRPPSLTRAAGPHAVSKWVDQIKDVVSVEQKRGRSVAAVLVHRDADGPDPQAAVEAVKPIAWRGLLPREPRDVELINDPKKELKRLTRGPNAYGEGDSPAIAIKVRELALNPIGRSASYQRFVHLVKGLS